LSDKYSWLSGPAVGAGAARRLNRGLPYDDTLAPKRMYAAIAQALTAARSRS
jgi:GH35 family endo-1,4-beta-xylanase